MITVTRAWLQVKAQQLRAAMIPLAQKYKLHFCLKLQAAVLLNIASCNFAQKYKLHSCSRLRAALLLKIAYVQLDSFFLCSVR
jgi:hypothetical protein